MRFFLSFCSLVFIGTPALAANNPFLAYVGTYQVVKSDAAPCEGVGCLFHIHRGDELAITASESVANVVADKMGLSLEMKEEHQDLGDGYTSDSGFSSHNGSAEYYGGTQVGGTSLELRNKNGLVEFNYVETRGSFTSAVARFTLQKIK